MPCCGSRHEFANVLQPKGLVDIFHDLLNFSLALASKSATPQALTATAEGPRCSSTLGLGDIKL